MAGIVQCAAYLPWRRLDRATVVAAHRWLNPALAGAGRGTRTMAAWDEDSITLAVEAARLALTDLDRTGLQAISLASTTLPFADRQNAAVVASALGLRETISAMDVAGSQRAAVTALLNLLKGTQASAGGPSLLVAADRRKARAASLQELQFGDAGAALVVSSDDGVARFLGGGSTTTDFVDHYRGSGEDYDYTWEERWVRDEGLKKIAPTAISRVLADLGVGADKIDHFILPSSFKGVDTEIAARCGVRAEAVRPGLADAVGDTGVAHPLIMLVQALEQAKPGERILLAAFGQGCDVVVFETTQALETYRAASSLADQLGAGRREDNYMRYLVFNEMLDWDKGKRAERDKQTALTTHYRRRDMLGTMAGGECGACGTRQFPATRVCVNPNCRGVDTQTPYSFADEPAEIISWSGDHLVFTPDPPLHYGFVAFREGGRVMVEFADCDPEDIQIGAAVRMAFRVKDYDPVRGFRRYFWKATPDRRARTEG